MENKFKKENKLTFTNIFFLTLFGLLIVTFKYYFTKGNLCHDTCSNINSELDVIKCLDACAINGEDFREPLSFNKILMIIIILIVLSFLLHQFINNFIIRDNGRNKILQFIQTLKNLKDKLLNKDKYEKLGYKKFDD